MSNILLKTLLFTLFALLAQTIFGQMKNFIDQPYLETMSRVDTLVTPDHLYLSISILESDTKGKKTIEELEPEMAKTLESIGIDLDKQLSLADFSSNFEKYFFKRQGILQSKNYELLVYDAASAGRVMYELENIGISNVNLSRAEYSKVDELKMELKVKAIKKAKADSETLAESVGQKIGKAIYISDMNTYFQPVQYDNRRMKTQMAGAADMEMYQPVPMEFQKLKYQAELQVKFTIE